MNRSGPDLALLLLAGFRVLVDEAITGLAELGHEDARPVHDFALRAIANGAESASELGRSLSITKQSAARTIAGFAVVVAEAVPGVAEPGPEDARPVHDVALRPIANGAESASELGRSLSITKQSAARTIAVLQERGYVMSGPDPRDARRKRLQV